MQKNYMTYRMAALLSTGISVVLYLFFILSLYLRDILMPHGTESPSAWLIVAMSLFGILSTFIQLFVLFSINFRTLNSKLPKGKKITVIVLGSVLFTALYSIAVITLQVTLNPSLPNDAPAHPGQWAVLVRDMFLAVTVMFISQMLYLIDKKQQAELRYEAMKAENAHSRFETLKNQLDPHFLFNTLNTLDSLIQEDPDDARNYLQQMSSVFRYVMPNKDLTTLGEELMFTGSYIELMQLRYEESLVFEFDVDAGLLNYQIVPLSIQTLVENAIKHNVISLEVPLVVKISVGPGPLVVVSNPIRAKKTAGQGSGIGLSNLAERFRLKFQKEITISNTGGVFTVTLPLQYPDNESRL